MGARVGENPDPLSAELLAANLIGPGSGCGPEDDGDHGFCDHHHYDDEDRLVKVVAEFFVLPSPPLYGQVESTA
ncbi:hypothetical protein [Streptomyces sp. NPDC102282]|uniref:hypothetical protein n=1 Tax=Streptomyces sp. NPDC102282 TaxID=3366154 RepID=UPI00380EFF18